MYLLSSDELKTYDHSACDIKIKIVIDFSYLNDMDLSRLHWELNFNWSDLEEPLDLLCVTDKPFKLIDSMNVSVAKQKMLHTTFL
jgi:hypothetical protein